MRNILLGLVVALLVLIGGVYFFFDRIAVAAIERGGEFALGVPTYVGSVSLQPLRGQVGIGDLLVVNPDGFENDHFLKLHGGHAKVDMQSLRQDPIVIEHIELSDISVSLERNKSGTNYGAILDHLGQVGGGGGDAPEAAEPAEPGPGLVIRELLIRNVEADVKVSALGQKVADQAVVVPEIRLTNLGEADSGAQMSEVIGEVTRAILSAVAKKSGGLGDLSGQLSRLGAGATRGGGDALREAEGAAKKALDGLLGR